MVLTKKETKMETTIPETEKLTFQQVGEIIRKYHKDNDITYVDHKGKPTLTFRAVFDPKASNWKKYENMRDPKGNYAVDKYGNYIEDTTKPITYSLDSCTYEFGDECKYWFGECCGNSLFAFCMNPHENDHMGIRLDQYLGHWKCLYCYQVK